MCIFKYLYIERDVISTTVRTRRQESLILSNFSHCLYILYNLVLRSVRFIKVWDMSEPITRTIRGIAVLMRNQHHAVTSDSHYIVMI